MLANRSQKVVYFFIFYLMFILAGTLLFFSTKAHASVFENGSNYPAWVVNNLEFYCRGSVDRNNPTAHPITQPSANEVWLSIAGNPLQQNITVERGQPLNLQLNAVAARCHSNQNTGIFWDYWKPYFAYYNIPGDPTNHVVAGIDTGDAFTTTPPNVLTERYGRDVLTLPINTNLFPSGGGTYSLSATAVTRQYAHRDFWGNYMCIMNIPQTVMQNHPAWTSNPNSDIDSICPVTQPSARVTITITDPDQSFTLDPGISCNVNAGTVTFDISKSGSGQANNINVTRNIQLNNSSGPPTGVLSDSFTLNNGNFNYGPVTENVTVGIGQSITASITVDPGGSDSSGTAQAAITESCNTPVRTAKPYLRVYGHDTVVGLPFPDPDTGVCSTGKVLGQDIETFSSNVGGNYVGSGSQFAASATGAINNFISASLRNNDSGAPKPPAELSFGNVNAPVGGDLSAYRGCIPDYISELDDSSFNTVTTTLPGAGAGDDMGVNYYAQDITILSNIIDESFPSSGNWDNLEQLQKSGFGAGFPVVIVKGNINIRPGVSEINAILIAIPDSAGNGGEINTCALSVANTRRECENQLVVNGALVAKKVNFDRLNGDVANASSDELSNPNIAEVINFRPELFLALSKHDDLTNLSRKNQYESIVGLPPVL